MYGDSAKFNIIGRLDVTQPIGGENWTAFVNSSVIKWNATGVSILCDVWYSANSGTNWNYIKTVNINTDGPGQTFWDANFSYPVTNNGRIKINSTLDDNVNGSSAADFNLIASLDVINPENGTVWVSNNTYPINWTTLGGINALGNVTLWFYNNSSWSQIGSGNITNTGNYSWQAPTDVISTDCKVKVQSPINTNNNNESSPSFTVKGNLTLTNPTTGSESWDAGSKYPINWTYLGPIHNITIQYCANGTLGAPWINLTDATPAVNGTWNWTIAADTELSTGKAAIKIFDHDQPLSESLSKNFTIKGALRVDTPNATGIVLNVGQNYNITWTKFGNIQYVNITYSNNSTAGPWKTIINNVVASNQTYQWQVPDDIGNTLRVNVTDQVTLTLQTYPTAALRLSAPSRSTRLWTLTAGWWIPHARSTGRQAATSPTSPSSPLPITSPPTGPLTPASLPAQVA